MDLARIVAMFRRGSQRSKSKMTRDSSSWFMMIMIISIKCLFPAAAVSAQESGGVSSLRKQALPVATSSKFLPAPWLQHLSNGDQRVCYGGRRSHVTDCSVLAPIDDLERFVAIAEIKPDLTCLLNPKGFDYGSIPALRDLNPAQADQLFGQMERRRRGHQRDDTS
jgi:hypothetical protein